MSRSLWLVLALSFCRAAANAAPASPYSHPGDAAFAASLSGARTAARTPMADLEAGPLVPDTGRFAGFEGGLEFLSLAPFNSRSNPAWGPVLKDIVNHEAPGDSNRYDDLVTVAHETSHGIHSYIRGHLNRTGRKANGFYVLADRAVVLLEPAVRKSAAAKFIPAALRGSRFATYITGQTEWDDTPLYIFDEWNGYVNGGVAGVDLARRGLWKGGRRDAVAGQLEFAVYALALARAVQEGDPEYFAKYRPFREFLDFNLRRCMESFREGAAIPDFRSEKQDKYYAALREGPEAKELREFARGLFGADWARDVMGF